MWCLLNSSSLIYIPNILCVIIKASMVVCMPSVVYIILY